MDIETLDSLQLDIVLYNIKHCTPKEQRKYSTGKLLALLGEIHNNPHAIS